MGIWTWIWTRPPKATDQLLSARSLDGLPKSPVATEKPAGTAGTWESEDSDSQAVSSKGVRPSATVVYEAPLHLDLPGLSARSRPRAGVRRPD